MLCTPCSDSQLNRPIDLPGVGLKGSQHVGIADRDLNDTHALKVVEALVLGLHAGQMSGILPVGRFVHAIQGDQFGLACDWGFAFTEEYEQVHGIFLCKSGLNGARSYAIDQGNSSSDYQNLGHIFIN
jgi:hypothetical protein